MNSNEISSGGVSKKGSYILSFIVSWTLLLVFIGKSISDDNLIYAIGEIHSYDNSLFNNNIYVGEGVISPRFIIDGFFSLIMKMNGGNWTTAVLGWIYFGAVIQSIAISNISNRINKEKPVIYSAIFTYFLGYFNNNLATFRPIAVDSASIGPALAFSFLAISFVVGDSKRYGLAWTFAGCAAISHVHEGLYCCAVILMIALADSIFQKKILLKENLCILITVLAIALVTIPTIITDHMDITDDLFVNIYAAFRHPHHLLPSSWGLEAIIKSAWINILVFLLSIQVFFYLKREYLKRYLLEAFLFEVAWFCALFCTYFFTEKMPLAFVSTMFLPKAFKYVVILSLIMLLMAFKETRKNGLYFSGYLLLCFAVMVSESGMKAMVAGFIVISMAIAVEQNIDMKKIFSNVKTRLVLDVLFWGLMFSLEIKKLERINGITIVTVFLTILLYYMITIKVKNNIGLLTAIISICLLVFSCYGKLIYRDDEAFRLISGKQVLVNSMGADAYELAIGFESMTDPTDEFMADPNHTVTAGWFQIVSERNCYVLKKVIPSSKSTVDDWYDRYMRIENIFDKEPDDIKKILSDSGIDYLLVNSDRFEKFDSVEEFSIFMRAGQDSLRIYKLE